MENSGELFREISQVETKPLPISGLVMSDIPSVMIKAIKGGFLVRDLSGTRISIFDPQRFEPGTFGNGT